MSIFENPEFWLGIKGGTVGLASLTIGSIFYMWGGRSDKWIRRFIGSGVVAAGTNVIAALVDVWQMYFVYVWAFLAFGFSLGYGGSYFWKKLFRRTCFALGCLSAAFWMAYNIKTQAAWDLFFIQSWVGAASIALGIRNPLPAAVEEVFVFVVLTLFVCSFPLTLLV